MRINSTIKTNLPTCVFEVVARPRSHMDLILNVYEMRREVSLLSEQSEFYEMSQTDESMDDEAGCVTQHFLSC
jgi:hypothetical protein